MKPRLPESTVEELVEIAKAAPDGDLRAFEELVRRFEGTVKANCRSITRSPNDTDDLAQEVFLKVYFAIGRFEGRSSFRTWLQRIKVNHCLNHLKKKRRQPVLSLDEEDGKAPPEPAVGPEAEARVLGAETRERIEQVLDGLPETLRIPLVLCDLDRLSYQEISETLKIGLSATKMRIKRAREMFRERFGTIDSPAETRTD